MEGLDINKSKKDFVVNEEDNKIYYGFGKIKGIGDEAAKRLQELQPYTNFEDFLHRFGTYADPVKAVIALRCFKDRDPITLYKFYEYYKKSLKGESDRLKRFERTKAQLIESIEKLRERKALLFNVAGETDSELLENEINKLQKKLDTCIANREKKDQFITQPKLDEFNPEEVTGLKLNEEYIELLKDPTGEKTEIAFYGYVWKHPIERVPGVEGLIFEEFLDSGEKDGVVEALVRQVEKKKGARATYYSATIEDATGYQRKVTIWQDDYERFQEELAVNNVVRLWVDAPQPPYRTFTMHALGTKWKKPPKANDYRVQVLGKIFTS